VSGCVQGSVSGVSRWCEWVCLRQCEWCVWGGVYWCLQGSIHVYVRRKPS